MKCKKFSIDRIVRIFTEINEGIVLPMHSTQVKYGSYERAKSGMPFFLSIPTIKYYCT